MTALPGRKKNYFSKKARKKTEHFMMYNDLSSQLNPLSNRNMEISVSDESVANWLIINA
jgi:hypothetical protein